MATPSPVTIRAREALRRWQRTKGDRFDPVLTERMREVVRLYCCDLSSKEIGDQLSITAGTVERTLHIAFVRLGLVGDRRHGKGTVCWAVGAAEPGEPEE